MRRWPIFAIFLALFAAAAPARALDTQAEHAVLMDAATGVPGTILSAAVSTFVVGVAGSAAAMAGGVSGTGCG